MANYTDIKSILQKFENTVVKGKHYTKTESDNKYLTKSAAGTQVTYTFSNGTLTITTK
jgi:hypothetical protein